MNKWVTYERALELLGGGEEYCLPGVLFSNAEQARALAAAKRALKYRIARQVLFDKPTGCYVCPSCKQTVDAEIFEFETGYCPICGQRLKIVKR